MYKRMLSGTGTEAKPPLRPGGTAIPGVPSWKSQFQKMSVPVMAIGANLSAVDTQEDAWAMAVYWNELVDDIDNHPDGNSFLQAYTMAVQARAKTRIPQLNVIGVEKGVTCGTNVRLRTMCVSVVKSRDTNRRLVRCPDDGTTLP